MPFDQKFLDPYGGEHPLPAGTTITWRPTVYGLIMNAEREVLMIMQTDLDVWQLPGGCMEPNETMAEALEREVWEETGYRATVTGEQPLYVDERSFCVRDTFGHALILYFSVQLKDGKQEENVVNVIVPDEVKEMRWLLLDAIKESDVHPVIWPFIKSIQG